MAALAIQEETRGNGRNMSLKRRNRIWWCKWQIRGRTIAESTGTENRAKAQEYHDRRRAALYDEARLGKKPAHSWDEAALDWYTTHGSKKKSAEDDRLRLKRLTTKLSGKAIDAIDATTIESAIPKKKIDGKPISPATRNRYMAVASAVMHRAANLKWISSAPKFNYASENNGRFDFLSIGEAKTLLNHLPTHLAALAKFSVATGLRRHNATHLQWSQIDMQRQCAWIWGDEAKSGKPLAVPLNADALAVLRAQDGKHFRWVFPYRGKPVRHTTTHAWKNAVKKIEREGFKWHGLRHTWASWHVMAGTPLEVLQRLGGWHSIDMVLRYAHLAPGYVAAYADRIVMDSPPVGTILGTAETGDPGEPLQSIDSLGWTTGLEPATTGITIRDSTS